MWISPRGAPETPSVCWFWKNTNAENGSFSRTSAETMRTVSPERPTPSSTK